MRLAPSQVLLVVWLAVSCFYFASSDPVVTWVGRPKNPTLWGGIRPQVALIDADVFLLVDMYFTTQAVYNATQHVLTESAPVDNVARRSGYSLTSFPSLRTVIAFGGDDGASQCGEQTAALLAFSPSSTSCASTGDCLVGARWTVASPAPGSPTPPCRMDHAAVPYGDSLLYIHGGRASGLIWGAEFEPFSDLWVVDVRSTANGGNMTVVWRQLPSSPTPKYRHSLFTLPGDDSTIYAAGGYVRGEAISDSVEYFYSQPTAQPHAFPFWMTLAKVDIDDLVGYVVGVIPLPHRLVYLGTIGGSGKAYVFDMTLQDLLDKSWTLGPLVSVAYGVATINSTPTAVIFETGDLVRLPHVLHISLTQASCDTSANQVESEFGDSCLTCPDGTVADGDLTCTPCSGPFLTLAPPIAQFCKSTRWADTGHRYEAAVAAPASALVFVLFLVLLYMTRRADSSRELRGTTLGAGMSLAILGFALDDDVALWRHSPKEMSHLTSRIFAEIRRITAVYRCDEVCNTGDHGILVTDAAAANSIFEAAVALQEAIRLLAEDSFGSLDSVTVRLVLHCGVCDSRTNPTTGGLVVSGRGIIALFDILARLPSGTLCVTNDFLASADPPTGKESFLTSKLQPSFDSLLTSAVASSSAAQPQPSESIASRRSGTHFRDYTVEEVLENTTRRFHGTKIFSLKPQMPGELQSLLNGSSASISVSSMKNNPAVIVDPPEICVSKHDADPTGMAHPLVSSGLVSSAQFSVLVRMTQRLYGALIQTHPSTVEESEFLFDTVADILRVQRRHRGAAPVSPGGLEERRTRDASYRLLEIIDMLQTKDVIAALTHT